MEDLAYLGLAVLAIFVPLGLVAGVVGGFFRRSPRKRKENPRANANEVTL